MRAVASVRAEPGRGLEGDRYWATAGTYSARPSPGREVTFIESEAIAALARDYDIRLEPGESRRNILTQGIALNHLVGMEFSVGEVLLRGVGLCEPCRHLEDLTQAGVRRGLVHRGGLRAQILRGGIIRVGDPIRITGSPW